MIDLLNDLTLQIEVVVFDLSTERIEIHFRLRPTIGTLVQEQEDKDALKVIVFEKTTGVEHLPYLVALKDLNVNGIKQWFINDYQQWVTDTPENKELYMFQLRNLYKYVETTGIK